MAAPIVPATGDLRAILIDNNAVRTNSPVVSLILSAENATEMMLSNTSDFAGRTWETFVTSKSWILLDDVVGPAFGDGDKTVFVKFRSVTLEESSVHSASIYLDTTPPVVGAIPIIINDGRLTTDSRQVTLTLNVQGADSIEVLNEVDQASVGTILPYADTVQWTLSKGNGSKTVLINFFDDIGNDTGFFSTEIKLVGQIPSNPAITEPENGATTTDHFITIRGTGDPRSTVEIDIEGE